MPSEPGESGSWARMARPASVRSLGEEWIVAPHVRIIDPR